MGLLNKREKRTIKEILKTFGIELYGGSVEMDDTNGITYHMSLDHSGANIGSRVGPILKEALGADRIFNMGIQIA